MERTLAILLGLSFLSFGFAITPGFTRVTASSRDAAELVVSFREEGLSPGVVTEKISAVARIRGASGREVVKELTVTRRFVAPSTGAVDVSVPLLLSGVTSGEVSFSNVQVEDLTNGLDEEWDGVLVRRFSSFGMRRAKQHVRAKKALTS